MVSTRNFSNVVCIFLMVPETKKISITVIDKILGELLEKQAFKVIFVIIMLHPRLSVFMTDEGCKSRQFAAEHLIKTMGTKSCPCRYLLFESNVKP